MICLLKRRETLCPMLPFVTVTLTVSFDPHDLGPKHLRSENNPAFKTRTRRVILQNLFCGGAEARTFLKLQALLLRATAFISYR